MKKNFMRALAPVLVCSMALGLTACGSNSGETVAGETKAAQEAEQGEAAASARDTLVIATANETSSLTTNLHNATAGDYMNELTHNGLFLLDENLEIQPDLVESYETLSDTEWKFKLIEGVKFHNGAELTTKDVKASLMQAKNSPEVAQFAQSFKEIEIIDDYNFKIITDGPQAQLLNDLTHHGNYILPADLIESGHDFNKEPIGTGPYTLVEWSKGESVSFTANPNYFKGEAPIKNIIWKIIPEGSSRTMALESGEVDLIVEVETTDVTRLKDNSSVAVYDEASTHLNFMMINTEKAPFNNADFRKAMCAAIDRDAIIQVALNGGGSPCYSQLPTCFPGTTDEGATTYDPEQAKAYLAASGLSAAECGFSLICSDDTKLRAGQVIQSCLKEALGVDVALESMDLATYLDQTASGDYQAAIGGFTSDTVLSLAKGIFHSSAINASNKTRTNDPKVDALIDEMLVTVDQAKSAELATELAKYLNELCPQVPLYLKNNTRAYNADLQGFNCGASGGTSYYNMSWGN
ncbi:MAG: ABC transporter substrate-binding protein [Lachnospiraceae bacterium]|nr:ABC transporter substrate-binding protein [Lachnospiraceae bacterium]